MDLWIVYRKGSFWLKERVPEGIDLRRRLHVLRKEGALYLNMAESERDQHLLARAVELPLIPKPDLG